MEPSDTQKYGRMSEAKENEVTYIYSWIDTSIQEDGFSGTLEKINKKRKIGPYTITKPIRNIMMSYFKVLLDTPTGETFSNKSRSFINR